MIAIIKLQVWQYNLQTREAKASKKFMAAF